MTPHSAPTGLKHDQVVSLGLWREKPTAAALVVVLDCDVMDVEQTWSAMSLRVCQEKLEHRALGLMLIESATNDATVERRGIGSNLITSAKMAPEPG